MMAAIDITRKPARYLTTLDDCTQELQRVSESATTVQRELQAANDRLQELDDLKSTFVALVSHELRTPTHLINGFLEIGLEELGDSMPPETQKYFVTARENAARLMRIVQELTDFARLQGVKPVDSADPIPLGEAIRQAYELLRPAIDARSLQVGFDIPKDTRALGYDSESLIVIFRNLLSNAAKFTPAGGNIWLTGSRGPETATVQIHDVATPIPPEKRDVIFEDFRQIENHLTRRYEGMGLGLAVARRTARALGGDITLTVRGEEGNTFTVTLPI